MRKENIGLKRKMYGLLDKWQVSGLSQKKFCELHGVSVSVLKYWKRKRNTHKGSTNKKAFDECASSVGFIALETPPCLEPSAFLQFHYPNGVRVECPVSSSFEQVERLIRIY